jgi:orotate phosphoribosyltransferase
MADVSVQTIAQVAEELHKNQLIKFGTFTLKSGIESPFYIDLREVQSHPSTYRAVVKAYSEMLLDIDPSVFLAGVPEAGTPLASMVGYELDRPLVQPRKVVKDHGTKSSVEGAFQTGDKVVLIDDLITKGDSKLEAIAQIEGAGLQIEKFLVLIDREQGGIEMIREKGYDIQAAFTITSLMNTLHEQDKISGPEYDTVMNFIKSN